MTLRERLESRRVLPWLALALGGLCVAGYWYWG